MRLRVAFEAVEQHDHRRIARRGRVEPIEVPEIAVCRLDALAAKRDLRAAQQIRPNRLRMAADEPRGRTVCCCIMVGCVIAHGSQPRAPSSRRTMVFRTFTRAKY